MTRVQFPVAEYILFILSKMVAQCGAFPDGKAVIAQLGERQTEDLEVLGSIPSPGIIYREFEYIYVLRVNENLKKVRGLMV